MKSFKRMISLVMALIMVLSILAACASESPTKGDATATPSQSGTQEPPKGDPAEITWYLYTDYNFRDEGIVWDEINKYLKDKINVTVNAQYLNYDDFFSKMPVMLSAGDAMDLVFTCSWLNEYVPGVAKGAFKPLNKLIDEYAPKTKAHVPQSLWDGVTINGEIYCFPTYKEFGQQYGFIINKTYVDKYNLDVSNIKTYKDMEPLYEIVKKNEPDMVMIEAPFPLERMMTKNHITGDIDLPGALNIPGIDAYTVKDDKIFNQYDTPEFKEFCVTMERWQKAGYLPSDTHYETNTAPNDWRNGKVFSKGLTYAPNYEKQLSEERGYEHLYIPIGKTIVETADTVGSATAIPWQSKNPEAAAKVMELVYTDKYMATMIRHGIENKHWVKVDENTVDFAPGQDSKDPGFDFGIGWELGSIYTAMLPKSYPKDTFEAYEKLNASAIPAPGLGFNFIGENVLTESSSIRNVLNEYRDPMLWGQVNIEEHYPKFLKALKDAGVDRFIEEQQKQYDEWKSKNGK